MRESRIETALVRGVKKLGGEVRKVAFPGRRGAPDRLCIFDDGALIWVELKAPRGRLSASQVREHKRLRDRGQTVVVAATLEAVERFLDDLTGAGVYAELPGGKVIWIQ